MQRIAYFDSMRGLAMTLVVIGHVMFFCFLCDYEYSPLTMALNAFLELPLFFFISGFFFYKSAEEISGRSLVSFIRSKWFLFLVTPLLFVAIRSGASFQALQTELLSTYKGAYWFTITLFELCVLFLLTALACKQLRIPRWLLPISLIIGLCLSLMPLNWFGVSECCDPLGILHLRLYIYFVFGAMLRRYFDIIPKLLSNNLFSSVLILALLFILYLSFEKGFSCYGHTLTPVYSLIFSTLEVAIVFATFKSYTSFSETSKVGKFFNLVGRRSLDVYFLHYFFLPVGLGAVGEWFTANNQPYALYALATALAIIIIFISLGAGAVIRLSPVLGHYILGAKYEPNKT